jgi:hypothetical protein
LYDWLIEMTLSCRLLYSRLPCGVREHWSAWTLYSTRLNFWTKFWTFERTVIGLLETLLDAPSGDTSGLLGHILSKRLEFWGGFWTTLLVIYCDNNVTLRSRRWRFRCTDATVTRTGCWPQGIATWWWRQILNRKPNLLATCALKQSFKRSSLIQQCSTIHSFGRLLSPVHFRSKSA